MKLNIFYILLQIYIYIITIIYYLYILLQTNKIF